MTSTLPSSSSVDLSVDAEVNRADSSSSNSHVGVPASDDGSSLSSGPAVTSTLGRPSEVNQSVSEIDFPADTEGEGDLGSKNVQPEQNLTITSNNDISSSHHALEQLDFDYPMDTSHEPPDSVDSNSFLSTYPITNYEDEYALPDFAGGGDGNFRGNRAGSGSPFDGDSVGGGPSSIEAQADSNDLDLSSHSLDLDLEAMIPEPSFPLSGGDGDKKAEDGSDLMLAYGSGEPQPLVYGPVPENGDLGSGEAEATDSASYVNYLDFLTGTGGEEEDETRSTTAVAGISGLRNIGNTCYMNSGLQCLFATAPIVDFFTSYFDSQTVNKCCEAASPKNPAPVLSQQFAPLLEDVWRGEFKMLKPKSFKDLMSRVYPQFEGSHQHDCQEFLALLLDQLHEELRIVRNEGKVGNLAEVNSSDCGTSMELHTSHSVDTNAAKERGMERGKRLVNWKVESDLDLGVRSAASGEILDGSESRESASPKSFDSHSSLDDKVTASIRQRPIPPGLKAEKDSVMEEEDQNLSEDDEEDTMDSSGGSSGTSNSSHQPTSNLVAPDDLKKREHSCVASKNVNDQNNAAAVSIDDYIMKDTKTLNVNVLAVDADSRNNEINFDSEKFSKHPAENNTRPRETIENLANSAGATALDLDKNPGKRFVKATNVINGEFRRKSTESYIGTGDASMNCVDGAISPRLDVPGSLEFGGIKRMRLDSCDAPSVVGKEKNLAMEEANQQRASSSASNFHMEDAAQDSMEPGNHSAECPLSPNALPEMGQPRVDPRKLKEAIDADRFWEKHMSVHDTVVARSFQGQFKNTVVCNVCGHVSVSFEPFMYLSVPLPNAAVRQTEVTFVGTSEGFRCVTSLLLDMTQGDNVVNLKTAVLAQMIKAKTDVSEEEAKKRAADTVGQFKIVEVLNCHISRTVEDWFALRHLKEDRDLYMVETIVDNAEEAEPEVKSSTASPQKAQNQDSAISSSSSTEDGKPGDQEVPSVDTAATDAAGPPPSANNAVTSSSSNCDTNAQADPEVVEFFSCVICMEDLPQDQVRQHTSCKIVLCGPCLERSLEHHESDVTDGVPKGSIKCPGCREVADAESEFVPPSQVGKVKPKLRSLTLPVVFRLDEMDASDNNKKSITLFGQPALVTTQNSVLGSRLHKVLRPLVRDAAADFDYELVLTDSQGKNCARCMFSSRCHGCVRIPRSGAGAEERVMLQSNDTIAISFRNVGIGELNAVFAPVIDASFTRERIRPKLNLDECLDAFSERETLDENNPWFCPMCDKAQCATKTLTIWRLPDYLIIYLKRFVFISGSGAGGVKLEKPVEFPLRDLDLTTHLSGPLMNPDSRPLFDLYAIVNHFGSVGGGHYTAFCRHLVNSEWNYFDDFNVTEKKRPGDLEQDQSSAYVLFYERRGASRNFCLPSIAPRPQALKPLKTEPSNSAADETNNALSTAAVTGQVEDSQSTSGDATTDLTSGVEVEMAAVTATTSESSAENPSLEGVASEVSTSAQIDSEGHKDEMSVDP